MISKAGSAYMADIAPQLECSAGRGAMLPSASPPHQAPRALFVGAHLGARGQAARGQCKAFRKPRRPFADWLSGFAPFPRMCHSPGGSMAIHGHLDCLQLWWHGVPSAGGLASWGTLGGWDAMGWEQTCQCEPAGV